MVSTPYVQYMYSYPHKTAYGPLKGILWEEYAKKLVGGENSLYFHIPFCESKCGYCNLFSVVGQQESRMETYLDTMERHAEQMSETLCAGTTFQDMTMGGGTPLLLSESQLARVFEIAKKQFDFGGEGHPIIVETSPRQTTKEKLAILKENQVTRVSMGVQSFFDEELQTLNRSHHREDVEKAVAMILEAGFPCVNLDLIYGIPGQTREHLLESARQAVSYEPEELFVYPLYVKQGTYLWNHGVEAQKNTYRMYLELRDYLNQQGYVSYSMRRFVKHGNVSEMGSCGFDNTISIGCGGRSYVDNLHVCQPYAVGQNACMNILETYLTETDHVTPRHGYVLSEEEQKRRYVIKNILFGNGISVTEYEQVFRGDIQTDFPIIADWEKKGYVVRDTSKIALTEEGISLSDYLGPMLISSEVAEKMRRYWDGIKL